MKISPLSFFLSVFFLLICLMSCHVSSKHYELNEDERIRLKASIDSLYDIDQKSRELLSRITKKYTSSDEQNKLLLKKNMASFVGLMRLNDSLNTLKLLEITKKYGFPNHKRLGVYKSKAYLIFVHSPRYFFSDIEELIEFEYKNNRMSYYERAYITWHIKGRLGSPPIADEKGNLIKRKTIK
ncbi:hypothetical protein [Psychroflexus sediminis]|uniref:Uncharacterized protein n=1 Tax=Psychroflexus sediminis TaxID=470826 RepID=A0A1G7YF01_9FLAO|nr:hypothetical protein [Psychroflexus sediminis]SDG94934.1 hypothetical protein SAMN04488027_11217 [Psychroflexus sediminis]